MQDPIFRSIQCLLVATILISGCTENRRSPTAPSAVAQAVPGSSERPLRFIVVPQGVTGLAVAFPPRNEPVMFREALNEKYRTRNEAVATSFVNAEGSVVWIQEYLRYRVNRCSHAEAMARVFRQLVNQSDIAPVCGEQPPGTVEFPSRAESKIFRDELEVRYRNMPGVIAQTSFVNIEGDIVWIQEYLRYRVNNCSHDVAQTKVFMQIDGLGVQPIDASCGAEIPRAETVAVITGPKFEVNTNTLVPFSGLESHSNQGRIVSYSWNCGQPNNPACTSRSATPGFRYLRTGPLGRRVDYLVTLEVEDEKGGRASTSFKVTLVQAY